MAPLDASELIADVAELYEPVAEEAGVRIVAEAPAGLSLHGNRELLGQALANLVDNALKHGVVDGAAGEVRIAAEPQERGLRLVVSDRGSGIPEGDRGRALERFVRLEESRSRPGSGLGLSLAAAIARLHGGTLRLEDNRPGLRAVMELPGGTG
jgi:signal transduction histidine kinase